MDPFSHLLLAYLIGFGVWGPSGFQYVIVAAVAGALPDLDIVLYPLSTRFPLLRHRGISHSIFGVTVIAAVGAFLVPPLIGRALGAGYASGSVGLFFVAMELGGLSHVLLDSMDHWSVPIFAPFSPTEYRFDADRIINIGSMAFTVLAYGVMLEERGRAPLWLWTLSTWVLLAVALGYILVRLLARYRAGIAQQRFGYTHVIPQASPWRFLFVGDETVTSVRRLRVATYDLFRGTLSEERSVDIPVGPVGSSPPSDPAEALSHSFGPAKSASFWIEETHPFAIVRSVPGGFEVYWYSLEVNFWGRAAGVLVRWDASTGAATATARWRRPSRAFSD